MLHPLIRLNHDLCSDLNVSGKREWLITNGLGGYASGTVSGLLSRSYHGYLIAALQPPVGRTLLIPKLEETIWVNDTAYDLSANRWTGGTVAPNGYQYMELFWLEGAVPCWLYNVGGVLLEKRIWMEQGSNTTYVRYSILDNALGKTPPHLQVRAFGNYRDHHSSTSAGQLSQLTTDTFQPTGHSSGALEITAYRGAHPFWIVPIGTDVKVAKANTWYKGYQLALEQERGLRDIDDHVHVGTFDLTLDPSATFILSSEPVSQAETIIGVCNEALDRRRDYEFALISLWETANPDLAPHAPLWMNQAVLAADQFVVDRYFPNAAHGKSLIAGYPWFNDWGRDAMISLPGLTLTTGRYDDAVSILRTFLRFLDKGLVPNNFPDTPDEKPGYNTVDGTLFFVNAIWTAFMVKEDTALLEEFYPAIQQIIDWHIRGTLFNIGVDPEDNLLRAGEAGVQLTWMDARVGTEVITPRIGKPVEINALWYNALLIATASSEILGHDPIPYAERADKVLHSFQKFYYAKGAYLYDVIDTPQGVDPTLRPNQIFAISLPNATLNAPDLLTPEQKHGVLEAVAKHLLTPPGLRSLAPNDSQFIPTYRGSSSERDRAYHQGTVWAWLTGPYVEACLRTSLDYLPHVENVVNSQADYLSALGLGTLSEIFDATAPFASHGCPAQAWSISELLRAWHLLEQAKQAITPEEEEEESA